MKFSNRLYIFLKSPEIENEKEKMYICPAGHPTIGIGHKLTKEELTTGTIKIGNIENVISWNKTKLNTEQCRILLFQDLTPIETFLNSLKLQIIDQAHFDALGAFIFNIGISAFKRSTLLKELKLGNFQNIPVQMKLWNKARNPKTKRLEILKGLVNRRKHEIDFWNGTITV
jgi:lysozyme